MTSLIVSKHPNLTSHVENQLEKVKLYNVVLPTTCSIQTNMLDLHDKYAGDATGFDIMTRKRSDLPAAFAVLTVFTK